MSKLPTTYHEIPVGDGDVITIIEQPEERILGTMYPGVYLDGFNIFWRVRFTLIEPGETEGYRTLTLVVPCGVGWVSAPPENTLSMLAQDAQEQHDTSAEEAAGSSGACFTVEQWKDIHKVWLEWYKALGEFFGPYFNDAMEFLNS